MKPTMAQCIPYFMWLAISCTALAGATLEYPEEQAAWAKIAQRFSGEPAVEISKTRPEDITKITVKGLITDSCNAEPNTSACVDIEPLSGHVVAFTCAGARITNEDLATLAAFSELRSLNLWQNGPINGRGNAAPFDGSGLASLGKLENLRTLKVGGGAFGNGGVAAISKVPSLRVFYSGQVVISDAGITELRDHPAIESLTFATGWNEQITDESVIALATCPNLSKLQISNTHFTWKGLSKLAARRDTLTELDLGNCLIEPAEVEQLRTELPNTTIKWQGLAGAGKAFVSNSSAKEQASKWIPADLIDRAVEAAKQK